MNTIYDLEKLTWKSEYNIGNLQIDNEHQKLFMLAKKALHASEISDEKKEKTQLKLIINDLYTYVGTHFSNEQKFMQRIKYPHYDEHKILHDNMLKTLATLLNEINHLEIQEIQKKLCEFIDEYFVRHIILEDKKIHLWQTPLDELRKTFGWKNIYSVNNSKIDQEHKQLFDIAKMAFVSVDDEHRSEKIKEVLVDLYDYMKIHFQHEEKHMEEINYPRLEEHKLIHKEIIKTLNTFVKDLPKIEVDFFEKELARMIDIVLVQHIIQEDRKIILWHQAQSE